MLGLQVIVSIHRRYRLIYDRVKLCSEIQLNVGTQFGSRVLQVPSTRFRATFAGCRVTVYQHLDGTLSIRYGPAVFALAEHASFHHKRDQTEFEDPSNPHARFHSFPPTETANDWHKFVAEMRRKLVEWSLQKPRALELIPLRGTTRHAVSVICSAGRVADA
jgi:hypothetical protein